MNQLLSSLAIILNQTLERTVRMEGFLALMKENCKACSAFPDHYPDLKRELDAIVVTVEQLIDVIVKKEDKK